MSFGLLQGALQSVTSQPCPSGKEHNVVGKIVKNIWGNRYCLHSECIHANMAEIEEHNIAVK
jgi:hypothetical protein